MAKEPNYCKHCRGTGLNYAPNSLNGYQCTSCNGTGMAGSPRALLLIFLASVSLFVWIAYRALCSFYD